MGRVGASAGASVPSLALGSLSSDGEFGFRRYCVWGGGAGCLGAAGSAGVRSKAVHTLSVLCW